MQEAAFAVRDSVTPTTTKDNESAHDARDDLADIDAAFHVDHWASEIHVFASTLIYDASKFLFGYTNNENCPTINSPPYPAQAPLTVVLRWTVRATRLNSVPAVGRSYCAVIVCPERPAVQLPIRCFPKAPSGGPERETTGGRLEQ